MCTTKENKKYINLKQNIVILIYNYYYLYKVYYVHASLAITKLQKLLIVMSLVQTFKYFSMNNFVCKPRPQQSRRQQRNKFQLSWTLRIVYDNFVFSTFQTLL